MLSVPNLDYLDCGLKMFIEIPMVVTHQTSWRRDELCLKASLLSGCRQVEAHLLHKVPVRGLQWGSNPRPLNTFRVSRRRLYHWAISYSISYSYMYMVSFDCNRMIQSCTSIDGTFPYTSWQERNPHNGDIYKKSQSNIYLNSKF